MSNKQMDMNSFVVRQEKPAANPKSLKRPRWERDIWETEGRFSSNYRHRIVHQLLQSYSVLNPAQEYASVEIFAPGRGSLLGRDWISSVEFDLKGIYLASVTSNGCLSVHDYETLYCKSTSNEVKDGMNENDFRGETRPIVQISTSEKLDVLRWNPMNQDEVGCVSQRNGKVLLFDIGYESSKPSQVLERKLNSMQQNMDHFGLSDLAFSGRDKFRVFACGLDGNIHVWDRRASKFSSLATSATSDSRPLSCLQLNSDEQVVFAGCKNGNVYAWDLRGGRSSTAFLSHKEVYHPPLSTITISSLLNKISSLKAQTQILTSGVQSVSLDPSCWYQLAFHLNNGWSGVLNLNSLTVTHIHCPPPPWTREDSATVSFHIRKPAWLPTDSIYAVGSALDYGINILDFCPSSKSPCYVDNESDGQQAGLGEKDGHFFKRKVEVSAPVVACTAHPLSTTIVGGTEGASLVLIAHNYESISEKELASSG